MFAVSALYFTNAGQAWTSFIMGTKIWQISRRCLSTSFTWRARVAETRGSFGILKENDVAVFERLLGASGVLTAPDDLRAYNVDWLNTCQGDVNVTTTLVSLNNSELVSYKLGFSVILSSYFWRH